MAQPIVNYDGNYITCYPGSNQKDDGKLNLEYNMARIVTRLSSKNFCIVKPSFELEVIADLETGAPKIKVGTGQCSINGMDLIMTTTLTIDPPETAGDFYLAFKLARDSSRNVLGDLVVGVSTTFEGLYLTYYTEKPDPVDADMFYLGKLHWDGSNFSDVIEDEDKYGRIWAEDILCKIEDPKHPDITRLTLQEWIYKVPDWYVSKEGDVEYGAIDFLPGRKGNNQPGISIQSIDNDNAQIIVKAPSIDNSDDKNILKILGNTTGNELKFGLSSIKSNSDNNYDLIISSPNNIKAESFKDAILSGNTSAQLNAVNSKLILTPDNKLELSNENFSNIVFNAYIVDNNTLDMTIGKSIIEYSDTSKTLSILQDNLEYFNIVPNTAFRQNISILDSIYIGSVDQTAATYLKSQNWRITETGSNKYINFSGASIDLYNPNLSATDNSIITLRNTSDTIHTKIYDDAKIELLNSSRNPQIIFKDGNVSYDVILQKILNQKKLNLDGDLQLINLSATGNVSGNGLTTTNGILTFVRGTNNATITKDNNSSNLRTSNNLYIGSSGNAALFAGNTTITGSLTTGLAGQLVIDNNGNINTSGTITGSKVFNAVYNGIGEIYRKDKNEHIEYGDIVCVREDGLVHKVSCEEDLDTIIGICSNTIGFELGGKDIPEDEQVEVEMLGQIWVKTDDADIKPGQFVKALPNGKCTYTNNKAEKLGITISNVINNKVRIVYNG